jgi:hypothetical protein
MRVLEPDPEVDNCPGIRLHLYYLTGLHVTNQAIAYSLICLIYDRSLTCSDGAKLDCYDVISAAGEPGMAIVTLGGLYFVLSCRSYRCRTRAA